MAFKCADYLGFQELRSIWAVSPASLGPFTLNKAHTTSRYNWNKTLSLIKKSEERGTHVGLSMMWQKTRKATREFLKRACFHDAKVKLIAGRLCVSGLQF